MKWVTAVPPSVDVDVHDHVHVQTHLATQDDGATLSVCLLGCLHCEHDLPADRARGGAQAAAQHTARVGKPAGLQSGREEVRGAEGCRGVRTKI